MPQYPIASITKSYSRKLNLAAYGGPQYESADFFESRNYSWFIEPTQEQIDQKGRELFRQCYNEVEAQVAVFINSIKPKQ